MSDLLAQSIIYSLMPIAAALFIVARNRSEEKMLREWLLGDAASAQPGRPNDTPLIEGDA